MVDAEPPSNGVRFFEVAEDDRTQTYFIAIAPHGGDIEEHTDDEAEHLGRELASSGYPASTWICEGFGDRLMGAFDRLHITSTDLNPASFPLLNGIATRRFCYGVAFHGFSKRPEDADLYIGGGASDTLKRAIRKRTRSGKFASPDQDCHGRRRSEIPGPQSREPDQPARGAGHPYRAIRRSQGI